MVYHYLWVREIKEIVFFWLRYEEWHYNSFAVCTVWAHSTVSQTPPHFSSSISLFFFLSAMSRAEQCMKDDYSMKDSIP